MHVLSIIPLGLNFLKNKLLEQNMRQNFRYQHAGALVIGGGLVFALLSCSNSSNNGPVSFNAPAIPAAASAVVPPPLTQACPITNSGISTLVTKGSGLAFGGASFGNVGTYTYTLAEATATVSPTDPCAATIVDLKNTTPNANGLVSYKFDVVILSPTTPGAGNGTLLYEVNNRTSMPSFAALEDSNGQDLFTAVAPSIPQAATGVVKGTGSGNGFLLKNGYTVVWSGWQGDRPQTLNGASAQITSSTPWFGPGMTLPVAYGTGGAAITGVVQDEADFDSSVMTNNLLGTYHMRAPNTPATLTIQTTATSTPIVVDPKYWIYTAGNSTAGAGALTEGGNTTQNGYGFVTINRAGIMADGAYSAGLDGGKDWGSLYHFNYTAINPTVMGLGFLGVRDLMSYLKNQSADSAGNKNPVAGSIKYVMGTGISQSGRFLRDFLWQGFNTDARLNQVFDSMLPLVGGSRKTYTNYRWSKPGDYSRQHETHYTPGDQFPFSYATITDPLTGKNDGLLMKCTQLNQCPKVYQYDSPIEFGGARASLTVTDGKGNDVPIPSNVRMFYAPGTQHGPTQLTNNAVLLPDYTKDTRAPVGAAVSLPNAIVASTALYRALVSSLDGWVKGTAQPLPNSFPKVSDGTMAVPTSNPASLGAPDTSAIGLAYNGVYNTLSVNDESVIPTVPTNSFYTVLLPTTDGQSNDKGGVKMPDIAVPLATFKGYSLRNSGYVQGDQYGLNASQLSFALNPTLKSTQDPRKSVQELYGTKAAYLAAWNQAVSNLVTQGFMLSDDAAMYQNRGVMQSLQANFATLP